MPLGLLCLSVDLLCSGVGGLESGVSCSASSQGASGHALQAVESESQLYIEGMTPLMISCFRGDRKRVEQLLQAGGSVDARDSLGRTAIWYARSGDIISLLVKYGASMNARDTSGATPLIDAASRRELDTVKGLLANGADPDARDGHGRTALMLAARERLYLQQPSGKAVARELLVAGADPNQQDKEGVTALMLAAESGQTDLMRMLLESGAKPNLKDHKGRSVVEYATRGGHRKAAILLRDWPQAK